MTTRSEMTTRSDWNAAYPESEPPRTSADSNRRSFAYGINQRKDDP